MITAEDIIQHEQQSKILRRIQRLPENIHVPPFSEWAEENRYLPAGVSPYPGRISFDITPDMREPLECLHPDSDVRIVSLMKSVQSTATVTVAENAIGAYIKYKLGSVLYLTSNKGVGKIRGSSAIDVMIDNSGLADYVKPMSIRNNRGKSDTAMYKEFAGGIKLLISSYNSIGDLKSNTFHLIIEDEWDEAAAEHKGQGDIEGIIEGRTLGIRNYKILQISTPSRMETSRIYKSYMAGDQRHYYVPCPLCGEYQTLVLKGGEYDYGLTFDREKTQTGKKILIPETVRYICQHCKGEFHESKKHTMMLEGEWRPTAQPIDRNRRSYHKSGLMVNPVFLSWERICQGFINTEFGQDLPKFKDFTINYLGRPWASATKKMGWEELKGRALDYAYPEVPKGEEATVDGMRLYIGPLILTGGVDVQKDRLELHVVAWGRGMESWSVDYQIFYGDPANIDDACWIALNDHIYGRTYKILGQEWYISKTAVDINYDPRREKEGYMRDVDTSVVYEFVGLRPDRFIAVRGSNRDTAIQILKESRVSGASVLKKEYEVATSLIKETIFSNLDKKYGPGAIHFPRYVRHGSKKEFLPDDHYQQFVSERYQEISAGKFGWVKIRARNEVLDTYIYARAAASFLNLESWIAERWQKYYISMLQQGERSPVEWKIEDNTPKESPTPRTSKRRIG